MKKILSVLLIFAVIFCFPTFAEDTPGVAAPKTETESEAVAPYAGEADAVGCILMEASSGTVLYEKNADEALPPASVTKVMTMLLVFEALDSGAIKYEDSVTCSERAASMGGTQIFLEPGERMSVDELLKSMIVSSANDAAVALAEYVGGSEDNFVARMNARAEELGMKSTHFENANGLDDTAVNHVTSARDIAIMTREVLKYEKATEYSSIWMDTVRNGEFGLSNTNRLIRFYNGATGLKTGSTSKAKFCISATATRDGMTLICAIMASPTRDTRNALAASLLDYGFASYSLWTGEQTEFEALPVTGGKQNAVDLQVKEISLLVPKGQASKIQSRTELPERVAAPVTKGQNVGKIIYTLGNEEIGSADIVASDNVEKNDFLTLLVRLLRWLVCNPTQ